MDPEAFAWFQAVDADRSGYISVKELKQALLNSNWSAFNDETCLLMISEWGPLLSPPPGPFHVGAPGGALEPKRGPGLPRSVGAFSSLPCVCFSAFLPDMFDRSRSGRMDVYGFSALLRFIQQWKNLFQQYDRDQSGSISFSELQQGG